MTSQQEERIVRLRASGVNSGEVARRVGCTRREVNAVMRKHAKEAR